MLYTWYVTPFPVLRLPVINRTTLFLSDILSSTDDESGSHDSDNSWWMVKTMLWPVHWRKQGFHVQYLVIQAARDTGTVQYKYRTQLTHSRLSCDEIGAHEM